MTIKLYEDKSMAMFQGDSAKIRINGIDTTENYIMAYAIKDKNNRIVFEQLRESQYKDHVIFEIKVEDSEKFVVPKGQRKEDFTYDFKQCLGEDEDTITVKGTDFGSKHKFTVYAKSVEGCI